MKTNEQIKSKLTEIENYLTQHYNQSCELYCTYLKSVLNSSYEDKVKYYNYLKDKVGPVKTYEQRQILKHKAEEFYNKNIKPLSRTNKNRERLWNQWLQMQPIEYDVYLWSAYDVMTWLFDDGPLF